MTYFKCVQPDGTDFATGRILYEVGKSVRPELPPPDEGPVMCGPGYLHAASAPTEAPVNARWPWRLLEVEGTPVVGFNKCYPRKGGFLELRVVRELPAHEAFGPQGAEIVALIERARRLTDDEAQRLDAAYYAAGSAAYYAARDAAWDAARDAARFAGWNAAGNAGWNAAWAAAWDAAVALVARDLISPDHFDVLYGPWRSVIEEA